MTYRLQADEALLLAFGKIADPSVLSIENNRDKVTKQVCDFLLGQLERTIQAFADILHTADVKPESVKQFLTDVMPLIYPVATVQKLNQALGAPDSEIVRLPCGRPVGISIALAAIEGRKIEFDDLRGHGKGFVDLEGISTATTQTANGSGNSALIDELRGFGPETGRRHAWQDEMAVILGTLATDPRYGMTLDEWNQKAAKSQRRLDAFAAVLNEQLEARRMFSKEWAFYAYQGKGGSRVSGESLDFIAEHIPGLIVVNMTDFDKSAFRRDNLITECVNQMIARMEPNSDRP